MSALRTVCNYGRKLANMHTKIRSAPRLAGSGLIAVAMVAAATAALGQSSADEQRIQLDTQQAQLTERLNRLDTLASVHGRYVVIRDTYLYGPRGVASGAKSWYQRVDAWITGWTKILTFFESATPASLAQVDVQNGIRATLKTQQDDWARLQRDALTMASRAAKGRAALAQIERLPDDYVPRYEEQIRTFNAQLDSLDGAFIRAATTFDAASASSWDQLTRETQTAVLGRLRQAMLRYPDLQQAMQRVDEFFRAERELGPHVRDVHQGFNQLRDHLLAHRIFHADDALAVLRTAAATEATAIDAVHADPTEADPARAEIASLLAAGEQLYSDSTRSFSHAALAASYKVSESKRLAALCCDMKRRNEIDCDLLRRVAAFPPEQMLAMDAAQLRYIELAFDQVAAGPVR
jgi:hypothetical protein